MIKQAFHTTRSVALAMAVVLAASVGPAFASEDLQLRGNISVGADVVTLGDLFENAGELAKIAVFRAPAPGKSGMLSTQRIAYAARHHGLIWENPVNRRDIVVSRAGTTIPAAELKSAIAARIAEQLSLEGKGENLQLSFKSGTPSFVVPKGMAPTVEVLQLSINKRNGIFRALVAAPAGDPRARRHTLDGRAIETLDVAVLSHDVKRGDIVADGDIKIVKRTKSSVGRNALTRREDIAGMAAKRAVRAGRLLRPGDLERPKLVTKGSVVLVTYAIGGLKVTIRGRSLSDGSIGQTVTVLNPKSKRKFQAQVAGPGYAKVAVFDTRTAALRR